MFFFVFVFVVSVLYVSCCLILEYSHDFVKTAGKSSRSYGTAIITAVWSSWHVCVLCSDDNILPF